METSCYGEKCLWDHLLSRTVIIRTLKALLKSLPNSAASQCLRDALCGDHNRNSLSRIKVPESWSPEPVTMGLHEVKGSLRV